MPPAGPDRSQRALAHYRWAERYSDTGEPFKSLAHMERALDYTRRPKTRFGGVTFSAPDIEFAVHQVMKNHKLTEFRNGGDHLPIVRIGVNGNDYEVSIEYQGRHIERRSFHYHEQPELSLQSIADALDAMAIELGMTADLRVKLQMFMGEAYGKVIEQMRADWPKAADGGESAKRPRP